MKKLSLLVGIIGLSFALSGCGASTGFLSKTGGAAITLHSEGGGATSNTGSKKGEACSMNILGIVSLGDSTVYAAKQNGGVAKVSSWSHDYLNILALYGKHCLTVRGE